MNVVSLIIVGIISVSLVLLIFGIIMLFQLVKTTKELKNLPSKPPKSRKKRKKWKETQGLLNKKIKKKRISSIVFVVLSIVLGAISYYVIYYQSTNLTSEDEKNIVTSYYLLRDFQKEIDKAAKKEIDESASNQNIRYLATRLASYTSNKASTLNTIEGQSALNRYYSSLSQLGLNATRESSNFYGNLAIVEEFQSDIKKTITYETSAFDYFKINQDVLKAEGNKNEKK